MPDLTEHVGQAVFWRPVAKIQTVTPDMDDSDMFDIVEDVRSSLEDELMEKYHGTLFELMGHQGLELLNDLLQEVLWDKMDVSLTAELGGLLQGPHAKPIRECTTESLWSTHFYGTGFTLAGKLDLAAKMQPLKDLWLAGNFIIGSDEKETIYVLAEKQT